MDTHARRIEERREKLVFDVDQIKIVDSMQSF